MMDCDVHCSSQLFAIVQDIMVTTLLTRNHIIRSHDLHCIAMYQSCTLWVCHLTGVGGAVSSQEH